MKNKNILLIVEGAVDEKTVLDDVFASYGFHTLISESKIDVDDIGQLKKLEYVFDNSNVVIIEGPRNRIHDFLKLADSSNIDIEKVFKYYNGFFQGIFLIYDVDHNDCDDVNDMFNRFCDESSGMLLLSSPCFEVIGDYNTSRIEEKYNHLSEYKADINSYYKGGTFEFMKKNFNKLMLYFLNKNLSDFKCSNVMEHPSLLVKEINAQNERFNCASKDDSYVIYRYFSTVVYVAIAYANSLTREIDNIQIVKDFFLKNINKK